MKIRQTLVLLALFPAVATASSGYVDVYFIPSAKLSSETGGVTVEDSGKGGAFKALLALDQGVFFSGEYQKNTYDDSDADIEQFRTGLGLYAPGEALSPFGLLEYIRTDTTASGRANGQSGYGAHIGLRGESGAMGVTLQAGYIDLDDSKGPEGLIEMDYQFNPHVGAIVGYRVSKFNGGGADTLLSDVRVGLSLYFGK